MNKNLDLTKILKDCPKGTKLYSPALGECTLEEINYDKTFPIRVHYKTKHNTFSELFTKNGYLFSSVSDSECLLFPSKDQKDWSKWHRPFKDGDIISYTFWRKPVVFIYRENGTCNTSYYTAYSYEIDKFYSDGTGALAGDRDDLKFATEEEKQRLFEVIKENGYKWNAKTKTLEKLKKEKFDPKTLKPFESKVLVSTLGRWVPAIFGDYNTECKPPVVVVGGNVYAKCIPYEGNKHLINTFNQPSEFYRYWEE